MINSLIKECAQRSPDRTFIVTDDSAYSFAQIYSLSRRFATLLLSNGIKRGHHVALIEENTASFFVAWFGINIAGGIAVTLNTQLVGDGLRYSISQSDAKCLVIGQGSMERVLHHLDEDQKLLPRILVQPDAAFFEQLQCHSEAEPISVAPSDISTIVYTSGTTGLPKGALTSHQEYLAVGHATVRLLSLRPEDRVLIFLPLYHSNPQMLGVLPALVAGASIALRRKFSATSFFDDAARLGATGFTFVGTVLSILAARYQNEKRAHSLRFCIGGGTPKVIWADIEARFGFKIHELYGMTEVGGWVSGNSVEDSRIGSCGRVRADMDVRVFDENDSEVPAGQAGEIVVRPKGPDLIFAGYYNNPEQTVRSCRNLWFHTGDRGSFDRDGYLYLHGRLKELIRHNGEMISPVEIETQLRRMPGIVDCAVVGVDDPIAEEEIKAVLVTERPLKPSAVKAFLSESLPRFMLPRYIEFASVIPKTETEKILRQKLRYVDESVFDMKRQGEPSS